MTYHRTGCAGLSYHVSGNQRPWQYRPSDHLNGNRRHVFGPILPMEDGRLPLRGTVLSWLRHGARFTVSTLRASITWRGRRS